MNLTVHALEGIIRQGNTFYDRWEELLNQCDFVMSNPPFNVDGVSPEKVKTDPRLFTEKKIPGIAAKTKAVSNANYLWIQYFYSYLNERGRAGFVMASSASDAGHGEKEIREELIATQAVDMIISIGTNFFYTKSLPCTLWFFDKGKPAERQDKVLMIDARNVYRVVTRKIRDFSEEQLQNIMEARNLKPTDLIDVIGASSVVSEIFNGKQEISKAQAKVLGEIFQVDAELFD